MNGLLIIDKPAVMTSHDVVARVRKILGEKSIGHLGTLDPMATGVLPLVLGSWTRLAQFFGETTKTYEGTMRFGWSTNTYDAEGLQTSEAQVVPWITEDTTKHKAAVEALYAAKQTFVGEIEQTPPPFSAKKISGQPAYKLARKGQHVELPPKRVKVEEFTIVKFDRIMVDFFCVVSSGTYVRSLVHDLGQKVGCGAHLVSLRRTEVGPFNLQHAMTLEELEAQSGMFDDWKKMEKEIEEEGEEGLRDRVRMVCGKIHPREILTHMPAVTATEEQVAKIRHGNAVNLPQFGKEKLIRVFANQTELVAIARRIAGTLFQPKVVLNK